nr:hypothetical protein [Tanacetum cinerariifolium]
MAISVISVLLDSLEESVGTIAGRVILFGTIPTTISDTTPTVIPPTTHVDTTLTPTDIPTVSPIVPSSLDYTLTSPDYSPASDTEFNPSEDPSLDHIPLLPATSPFLSSMDDASNIDIPDTPPSPTHGTPFTEITLSTQRSPAASGALRRRVMIPALGQHIPHSRPYRYHPNGPSSVPIIPHSSAAITERPSHPSFVIPSCKRSRSPTTYVPIPSPVPRVLSPAHANLLPPPKRIRNSDYAMDLKDCSDESSKSYVPRETSLRDDVSVRGSDEPYSDPDINLEIQAEMISLVVSDEIPEPAQEEGAIEGAYEMLGALVQILHGHTTEILVHRVQVIEGIQRDQGHMKQQEALRLASLDYSVIVIVLIRSI